MRRLVRAVTLLVLAVARAALPRPPAEAIRVPKTLAHRAPHVSAAVRPAFSIDSSRRCAVGSSRDRPGHDHEANGTVRFRRDGVWSPWVPLVEEGAERAGQWASGWWRPGGADAYPVRGPLPTDAVNPRTVSLNTTDGPLVTSGV